MSKNIEFNWFVESSGEESLKYEDMGLDEEYWNSLTEEEKEEKCERYIFDSIAAECITIYPFITKLKTL